jgi:predicted RNA binding protein YcfA (HicA-like mRNA interferase family)
MRYSSCRDVDKLVRDLVKSGWTFWRGGKHGRLKAPSTGASVTVPGSPSDHRAFLNFRRDVRSLIAGSGG